MPPLFYFVGALTFAAAAVAAYSSAQLTGIQILWCFQFCCRPRAIQLFATWSLFRGPACRSTTLTYLHQGFIHVPIMQAAGGGVVAAAAAMIWTLDVTGLCDGGNGGMAGGPHATSMHADGMGTGEGG